MCLTDFSHVEHVEHVERVEGVFSLEFRVWSAGVLCKICTIFRFTRKAITELNGEEVVSLRSKFLTLEVVGICGQMF